MRELWQVKKETVAKKEVKNVNFLMLKKNNWRARGVPDDKNNIDK